MCGIVGFLADSRRPGPDLTETVTRMAGCVCHRGPDDAGAWSDPEPAIALGHRRLSILDLSPQGHQPMHSASGRFVIVFNGEIYNYRDIRQSLEREGAAPEWRGHSDTEVMLAAIERWGVRGALDRFNGMFAFALWDRAERTLVLARDRVGEKPLYFGWMGNVFLFGSELKALRDHPDWRGEIDRDAVALFMRHSYVPGPRSIYRGIHKLTPGTLLTLPWENGRPGRAFSVVPYWSARQAAEAGVASPFVGSPAEAEQQLDALLRNAVGLRMEADVPLGAFLSGGVDSSLVVALMQAQADTPVSTFSIGFTETGYDEAQFAKAVARHLGTSHTEMYVTPEEAMAVITLLPGMYDEPFADSSQIPTFLVSQLARRSVTVSLSGDAGDELFGGYNRYFWGQRIWGRMRWMPRALRLGAARSLRALSVETWEAVARPFERVTPSRLRVRRPGEKAHKLADVLGSDDPGVMYRQLITHWGAADRLMLDAIDPSSLITEPEEWARLSDFTHTMMYLDLVTYLPDDILVKVDRAAMAVSLESRVPLLDHRLIEFAWRLPLDLKVRDGQGKWLLRRVLDRYVPRTLIHRPKMGFGVPIGAWLRGPLRDWAESLLDPTVLRDGGLLDDSVVRQRWNEHLSGERDWQYHLWDVLMFQAWIAQEQLAPA